MEEDIEFIPTCITIRQDQKDFLKLERKFKLSKFIQVKLDEYIKFRKEYKQFMEKEVEEEDDKKTI